MDDPHQASRTVSEALDSTRATFCTAIVLGDARAAAAGYAVDAWLLPPNGPPMHGRAEVEAFWRAGILAGVTSLSLHPAEFSAGVDLAYEVGDYQLRLAPVGEELVVEQGSYLLVHQRQPDGSWLRVLEALQPTGAPAIAPLPRFCNASPSGSSQAEQEGSHT